MHLVALRIYDWNDANDAADRLYIQGRTYVLQLSESVHGPTPPRIMSMSEIGKWLDDRPEQIMASFDGL
ncbi:hypothetical protein SAMN06265338_1501 [Rhodoblastus acidophilus]|uniref:Uncharacterized protein n=1 Tax=Rhodoblastus acidophilus TaxID=1074 RepID=A0A212SHL9_RHOAC|nr:hypothetical protein [Rhodoblastus acidophilus]MCW2319283.1 hypothetical protein [Rhodoblastus acidophilus]PPQ34634.1 hypothetical protein CKO16_22290 [Rhodoblastus acidophilus]RAI16292.1 hypothetical protein CH337_22130 [Rhodoblastus acidophilus]SNB85306.1 hypothetical protein SAMN06265338_1501 [Rhodoblastus acidophilus]